MPSSLSVKRSVGFLGVDWAADQKKSQRGLERRKKEQQYRRAQRKAQRRMSNEQLKSFLQSVVSPEENAKGNRISLMSHCNLFLELVEKAGVVALSEESSNVEKVRLSLEKFDNMKDKPSIRIQIQACFGNGRKSPGRRAFDVRLSGTERLVGSDGMMTNLENTISIHRRRPAKWGPDVWQTNYLCCGW